MKQQPKYKVEADQVAMMLDSLGWHIEQLSRARASGNGLLLVRRDKVGKLIEQRNLGTRAFNLLCNYGIIKQEGMYNPGSSQGTKWVKA